MIKTKKIYFTLLILLIMVACNTYVTKKIKVIPPFDYSFIKTIAVIEFNNSTEKKDAGKIITDRIEQLLFNESGYKVLNHVEIEQFLKKRNLSYKGTISSSSAIEIGKAFGIDALLVGNVEDYQIKKKEEEVENTTEFLGQTIVKKKSEVTKLTTEKEVTIAISFKLLNTSDGSIVWSKSSHGEFFWSPVQYRNNNISDFGCFQRALENIMIDIRNLFPHEKEERVPVY